MKKLAGYILSPFALIAALIILVVFQPVMWFFYKVLGAKAHKTVADIIHACLIACCYLLGNRVVFINKQNLPKGRPIIFLSNHQSFFDISPLSWFLRGYHPKFVSKIELTKGIPTISFYLKVAGGANIDRNNPRQSLLEIAALGKRMRERNWSAIIFPEGTRSSDGQVKDFQSAGIITLLKKCPEALLVPIAINNSWKLTANGIYPLGTFNEIRFEVLPPIELGKAPVEELVELAEQQIRARVS